MAKIKVQYKALYHYFTNVLGAKVEFSDFVIRRDVRKPAYPLFEQFFFGIVERGKVYAARKKTIYIVDDAWRITIEKPRLEEDQNKYDLEAWHVARVGQEKEHIEKKVKKLPKRKFIRRAVKFFYD